MECFDLLTREKDLNKSVELISQFNQDENLNLIIMDVLKTHKHKDKFFNYLLFLLNKQINEIKKVFNICKLISDLMDLTNTSLFYKNDLDSFISICIKTLESTYDDKLRYSFLNILNKIVSHKDYFESRYKLEILVELLEHYYNSENIDEKIQKISKEILEKIDRNSNDS